jgi:hypothetical protein
MTEYTDNLIAEAKAEAEARYNPDAGICQDAKLGFVEGAQWHAALGAVQPVSEGIDHELVDAQILRGVEIVQALFPFAPTPGEVISALRHAGWVPPAAVVQPVTPDRDGLIEFFNDWHAPDGMMDALLASGVLGQPQPQPDREAVRRMVYDAGGGAFMSPAARYGQSEAITDALLPLLGQPRTDAPLDPEPSRLEVVARLLDKMPVLHSGSSLEPELTVRMIDFTAIRDVAHGLTHPDEWVHEPCEVSRGEHLWNGKPYIFSHSPHHWTDYQDGREPLRLPHWCNGTVEQDQARYPRTDTPEPGDKP